MTGIFYPWPSVDKKTKTKKRQYLYGLYESMYCMDAFIKLRVTAHSGPFLLLLLVAILCYTRIPPVVWNMMYVCIYLCDVCSVYYVELCVYGTYVCVSCVYLLFFCVSMY